MSAFAVLFAGHALVPDLAIVSFGKRWYLSVHILFALIPALVGAAAATLARRREDS